MKKLLFVFFTFKMLLMMAQNTNPLGCDFATGACSTTQNSKFQDSLTNHQKTIKVIYFTDPICSSCWGIEPQLRKLKLEYAHTIQISYHMGGLLPDWNYNSDGISKPSDVAIHWDEASAYYDMPINGDIWLENPLDSSYPPSIAFKAAQMQDTNKAVIFLRELRQMLFLLKKNITQWKYIEQAAQKANLDVSQLKNDYKEQAQIYFQQDLELAQKIGIKGFPTMIFVGTNKQQQVVYGAKSYAFFEAALLKINPNAQKQTYSKDWKSLFDYYSSYTLREFSEISGMNRQESQKLLDELTQNGILQKWDTKNGSIWIKR